MIRRQLYGRNIRPLYSSNSTRCACDLVEFGYNNIASAKAVEIKVMELSIIGKRIYPTKGKRWARNITFVTKTTRETLNEGCFAAAQVTLEF